MKGQGMLNVKPTSEETSNSFYIDSKELSDTTSGWIPFDYPFHRLFSQRVVFHTEDLNRMNCQRLVANESAYLSKYQEHINVTIPNQNYLVNSFKGAYSIYIFFQGELSYQELLDPIGIWTEGPPDDAWIVQSWVLDADQCTIDHEHEIGELKSELRNLLYDFKSGIPLSRPVELLRMAEKVANQIESKTEKDIDKWAEDLSNEISKLSD